MCFLSATWYKDLEMNRALEKKMSELATPKRRNFKIPAGKYGKILDLSNCIPTSPVTQP